jgi:uncharacterized integral membrane protein
MKSGRWIVLLAIALLSGLFAYFNGGERITLNLGFMVVYRVSLVGAVFSAFILGMVTMFLIGLRHDMRMRRVLRERDLLDGDGSLREHRHQKTVTPRWGPPLEPVHSEKDERPAGASNRHLQPGE